MNVERRSLNGGMSLDGVSRDACCGLRGIDMAACGCDSGTEISGPRMVVAIERSYLEKIQNLIVTAAKK